MMAMLLLFSSTPSHTDFVLDYLGDEYFHALHACFFLLDLTLMLSHTYLVLDFLGECRIHALPACFDVPSIGFKKLVFSKIDHLNSTSLLSLSPPTLSKKREGKRQLEGRKTGFTHCRVAAERVLAEDAGLITRYVGSSI